MLKKEPDLGASKDLNWTEQDQRLQKSRTGTYHRSHQLESHAMPTRERNELAHKKILFLEREKKSQLHLEYNRNGNLHQASSQELCRSEA